MRRILSPIALLTLLLSPSAGAQDSPDVYVRVLNQVGSPDAAERDAAFPLLIDFGTDRIPLLRESVAKVDPTRQPLARGCLEAFNDGIMDGECARLWVELHQRRKALDFTHSPVDHVLLWFQQELAIPVVVDRTRIDLAAIPDATYQIAETTGHELLQSFSAMLGWMTVYHEGAVVFTTPPGVEFLKERRIARARQRKLDLLDPPRPQDLSWPRRITVAKLATIRVSMTFSGIDLKDVAEYLNQVAGVDVDIDPGSSTRGSLTDRGVYLSIENAPLGRCLALLCDTHGFRSEIRDGVLYLAR